MDIGLGLIDEKRFHALEQKKKIISEQISALSKAHCQIDGKSVSLGQALRRPEFSYSRLLQDFPNRVLDFGHDINEQIELEMKYAGYIERQKNHAAKLQTLDNVHIAKDFNFLEVRGLSNEAKEKLHHFQPITLGQASRISGVSPADITVLMIALKSPKNP